MLSQQSAIDCEQSVADSDASRCPLITQCMVVAAREVAPGPG